MSAVSRRAFLSVTALLSAVAGCLWRPKPYAGDPLVRTLRADRNRPVEPTDARPTEHPTPPTAR
jgi:hypothetical protein